MTPRGRTLRSVCTSADVFVTSCVTSMRTHSWCSPLSARARALRCAGVRDQASRGALHARMCTPIRTYTKYIGTHSLNPPHRQHKSFCTRADIYVVDVSCARTWTPRRSGARSGRPELTAHLSRTAGLVAPAHRAREGACVGSLSRRHGGRIGASDASPWPARARHRSRSLAEPASRSPRREASRPREVRYHSRACLRSCGACCCAPTHPARRSRSERVPR